MRPAWSTSGDGFRPPPVGEDKKKTSARRCVLIIPQGICQVLRSATEDSLAAAGCVTNQAIACLQATRGKEGIGARERPNRGVVSGGNRPQRLARFDLMHHPA